MSRPSYRKLLGAALAPHGFTLQGKDYWSRTRGDMHEAVDRQVSNIAGITSNLFQYDLETARILREIGVKMVTSGMRIGELIDGRDRWWRDDPNGPTELTEAVLTYGLPHFDKVRSLEEQAAHWYGRGSYSRWHGPTLVKLAVTLYRMGELKEAYEVLAGPVPKTAVPSWVEEVRKTQRWLECQQPV